MVTFTAKLSRLQYTAVEIPPVNHQTEPGDVEAIRRVAGEVKIRFDAANVNERGGEIDLIAA